MNLFQPSVKVLKKLRVGARLRRIYNRAQTPCDRVRASGVADRERLARPAGSNSKGPAWTRSHLPAASSGSWSGFTTGRISG